MLKNWYFVRCVRLPAASAAGYLSIQEELESACAPGPLDEHTLVPLIERLRGSELFVQCYAACTALEIAVRDDAPARVSEAIRSLVQELVHEHCNDEQAPALSPLVDALIDGDEESFVAALDTASKEALKATIEHSEPYLDLRTTVAPTLLLAMLDAWSARDERLAGELRETLAHRQEAATAQLIDRALEGDCGRLALVHAARASARLLGARSEQAIVQRVWYSRGAAAAVEPDLVSLIVELLFAVAPEEQVADRVARMHIECLELHVLNELLRDLPLEADATSERLREAGLPSDPSRVQALGVVLWQTALWEQAAALEPRQLGQLVGKVWGPVPAIDELEVECWHNGRLVYPQGRTRDRGDDAWCQRWHELLRVRGETVGYRGVAFMNLGAEQASKTRALMCSPWLEHKQEADGLRYLNREDPVARLRLYGAAAIAARVLRTARPDALKRTIAHAFDVAREAGEEDDTLEALRSFVHEKSRLIGCGYEEAIDPHNFVGLAHRPKVPFDSDVLPSILLRWLEDAVDHAIDARGPGRWRDHIAVVITPRLEPSMPAEDRVRAALLARFSAPEARITLPEDLTTHVAAGFRRLLLAQPLRWFEWVERDDAAARAEAGSKKESSSKKKDTEMLLVTAMQRVASIDESALGDSGVGDWCSTLGEALRQIGAKLARTSARRLDPFIRVQLAELLESFALRDDLETRWLIASLLIEHGTAADLLRVFALLAPPGVPAPSTLLSRLVQTLLAARELAEGRRQEPLEIGPAEARERALIDGMIDRQIAELILDSARDPALESARAVEVARYEPLARKARHGLRAIDAELVETFEGSALELSGPDLHPWAVRAVDRDPRKGRFVVSYVPYAEPSHGELGFVLGAEREGVRVALRDGRRVAPATEVLRLGDAVAFDRRPRALERAKQRGDLFEIEVEARTPDKTRPHVRALHRSGRSEPLNLDEFLPDVSWCFSNAPFAKTRVLARWSATRWVPVIFDASMFLACEIARSPDRRCTFALTKVQTERDEWVVAPMPGRLYRLFARDFEREALEALREQCKAHQNPAGLLVSVEIGPSGRLLQLAQVAPAGAMQPALSLPFDTRNLRWRAWLAGEDTRIARREIEGEGTGWVVDVDEDIPGMPRTIAVGFAKEVPDVDDTSVELCFVRPDPRLDTALAQLVPSHELESEAPAELIAKLQRVASGDRDAWLPGDDLVQLDRVVARPDGSGNVLCTTSEGLLVKLPSESLSMSTQLDWNCRGRSAQLTPSRPRQDEEIRYRVDLEDVDEWIRGTDSVSGILQALPDRRAAATTCVAWLVKGDAVVNVRLPLDPRGEMRRIRLGALVDLTVTRKAVEVSVQPLRLFGRALWDVYQWDAPPDNSLYLGRVSIAGFNQDALERHAGEIALVPPLNPTPLHLARWSEGQWNDGLPANATATNPEGGRREVDGRERRVYLQIGDHALAGVSHKAGEAELTIAAVLMQVARIHELDAFVVKRVFRATGRTEEADDDWEDTHVDVQRELERLLGENQPLVGRLVANEKIAFSSFAANGARFNATLAVAPGVAPHIKDAKYSREQAARFMLRGAEGGIVASIDDVPAFDPAKYRTAVGLALGKSVRLAPPLYYVGPKLEAGEVKAFFFELGIGQTLLVPVGQLFFNGEARGQLSSLLFHGDAISTICFREIEVEREVDGKKAMVKLIAIEMSDAHIEKSPAYTLFAQARRGFVHTLNIAKRSARHEIENIEGFNEQQDRAPLRAFRVANARLDDYGEPLEASPSAEGAAESAMKFAVLGKLDTALFVKSEGREVLFKRVRLTRRGERALAKSDVLFLRIRGIRTLINDAVLVLERPAGLRDSDVGEDAIPSVDAIAGERGGITMPRRAFSVRESMLELLWNRSGTQGGRGLVGSMLAVAIPDSELGEGLHVSFGGVPARRTSALRDLIRGSKDTSSGKELPVYALVDSYRERRVLRLEYQAGMFFDLEEAERTHRGGDPQRGSMVRLELDGKLIAITRCDLPDVGYASKSAPRAAVVFPQNMMWDRNRTNREWKLTVGGLPDLKASLAQYANNTFRPPNEDEWVELMSRRHPKIGWVTSDWEHRPAVAPAYEDAWAGYIELDGTLRCVSLDGGARVDVEWWALSFSDRAASEIEQRVPERVWRYHDTTTAAWTPGRYEKEHVGRHTVFTGPLFFSGERDLPQLRYAPSELRLRGFPARFLQENVGRKELTYAVAGVARDGSRAIGLWIEYAPGMLFELSGHQISFGTGGQSTSLGNFCWSAFAPGDEVTLRVTSSAALGVDYFEMVEWRPSARAAFAPAELPTARTLLPVQACDVARGAMRLGAGRFVVTRPSRFKLNASSCVWLDARNAIAAVDDGPARGDVVLLALDDDRRIVVAGCRGVEAFPDRENANNWTGHRLASFLVRDDDVDMDALVAMIEAAGGAVPATVEAVNQNRTRVYFSFRHQRIEVADGERAVGRVLGVLPNDYLLLRVGAALVPVPAYSVLGGITKALLPAVSERLRDEGAWIWLRQRDGVLRGEVEPRAAIEGNYQAVCALGHETRANGLICRSLQTFALALCPVERLVWADPTIDLTTAQVEQIFLCNEPLEKRRTFRALRRPDQSVSIVDTALAAKERDRRLKLGSRLRVNVKHRLESRDKRRGIL